jgi:hypothetical protein
MPRRDLNRKPSRKLIVGRLIVALLAVVGLILAVAPSAQADPLTYRDQQWIQQERRMGVRATVERPHRGGVNSLIGSLVLYYEVPGNAGTTSWAPSLSSAPSTRI